MSLQDEQARAERDASALRSILSRYPNAKREDGATGVIIASVPMSAATVVSVDVGKGGRQFVRFGDGEMSPTVWQADGYEVVDLLEALIDVPGGREALAKATETGQGAAKCAAREALRAMGVESSACSEET